MSYKWLMVARKVEELTKSGQLSWQETSSDWSFQAKVGTQMIELSEEKLSNQRFDYEFKIYDRNGNIVDIFSDADLMTISNGEEWEKRLHEVTRLIKRRISGAEDALDSLIRELDKKADEIPF